MPSWIEKRKDRILAENPEMEESQAWAIATQQAHSMNKTPKGYGTSRGRSKAKKKYKYPEEYQQRAERLLARFVRLANTLDTKGQDGLASQIDRIAEFLPLYLEAKKENPLKDLKKGRFTEYCKRKGYSGPCKACADEALKSDDESVRGMGTFYLNFAKGKKK